MIIFRFAGLMKGRPRVGPGYSGGRPRVGKKPYKTKTYARFRLTYPEGRPGAV